MITEYLKELELEDVGKLKDIMNGILNGAAIPKAGKENRMKLLHKVISIICKLCMLMMRERIYEWT